MFLVQDQSGAWVPAPPSNPTPRDFVVRPAMTPRGKIVDTGRQGLGRQGEQPINFNEEMAAALGDSFKSPRMVGSGGRQGGGNKAYAKDPRSVQYQDQAPNFLRDLLFMKKRGY
jgi:hypothetical protein